jgi:hypothetical protein
MLALLAAAGGCVKMNDTTVGEPAPRERLKPEPSPHLVGRVSGRTYYSAHGGFAVTFPVSLEYGGRITHDDAQSVTFGDRMANRISFFSKEFSDQSPMKSTLRKEGAEKALEILVKDIYGTGMTTHYHADARGGTLSFIFVKPLATKTGVAAMVFQNRVYLVETDLPPGVQFLSKQDDEGALDEKLENYAVDLLRSVEIRP